MAAAWRFAARFMRASLCRMPREMQVLACATSSVAAISMHMTSSGAAHERSPDHDSLTPPPPARDSLIQALQAVVGSDNIITNADELAPYGRDSYSYHSGPPPHVVVFASSTEQVASIVKLAGSYKCPIIARGAGTSLEGHTTTPMGGIVLDMSRMDAVLTVREADMDCDVQAGVVWSHLNEALKPRGLWFPVDPGPGATIGGMCGTRCSGTNAVRHGTMRANVVALTVVLADGSIVRTGRRSRKSAAGYDLTGLIVGSEGTLGIVTEATLRLVPVPEMTAVAVAAFPTLTAASDAVAAVMRTGMQLGAVELLDAPMIAAINVQSGFAYAHVPHLFFKFAGSAAAVNADAARVQDISHAHGGSDFQWTADAAGQQRLWEARKVALWSAAAMDTSRAIATTDVCVPISRMPDLLHAMEVEAAVSGLKVYAVGHAGDGNVHHFIAFDTTSPEEVAAAKKLNAFLVHTALSMDGTCTGEHGVGVGKQTYLVEEFGQNAVDLMHALKQALDPHGILNPGKKLPPRDATWPAGPDSQHARSRAQEAQLHVAHITSRETHCCE